MAAKRKAAVKKAIIRVPMIVPSSQIQHLRGAVTKHEILELDDAEFLRLRKKYGCLPESSLK